jgi:ribosomal 50S subunit-recycling heat shock protein
MLIKKEKVVIKQEEEEEGKKIEIEKEIKLEKYNDSFEVKILN